MCNVILGDDLKFKGHSVVLCETEEMSGLKKIHFQLAQQENLHVPDDQLDCTFFEALKVI